MRYYFLLLPFFFSFISFSQIGDCNNGGATIGGPFTDQVDLLSQMVDVATNKLTSVGKEDFGSGITNTSKDLYYKVSGGTKGAISFMLYSASIPNNCLTYKAELYDVGNCTAVVATSDIGIYHSTNVPNFVFNNVLNKDYILKLTLTVPSGCNLQSVNLGYFHINPPVSCIACANSCSETLTYTSQNSNLTTAFNDLKTKVSSNIGSFYNIPIKKGQTKTICVNVNIPQNTKTIGFRQEFISLDGNSCGTPKFTYKLYDKNCSNTTLIPARPNANNFGSGFNPEYDNPPAGDYRMCLTIENNTSSCEVVGLNFIGAYIEAPTTCNASIGNVAVTGGALKTTNEYDLSLGSTLTFTSTGTVMPTTSHINSYAIFNCDPGVLTAAQLLDLNNHPCYVGSSNKTSETTTNENGIAKGLPGNLNKVWVVPYTRFPDNTIGGTKAIVNDGTGCYKMGTPIIVNYLSTNTPPTPCGTCATPTCPIGNITTYKDRFPVTPLDPTSICNPTVFNCPGMGAKNCAIGIKATGTYTTYQTVVADGQGKLGVLLQDIISSPNTSLPPTVTSKLYSTCSGSAIPTSNFNPLAAGGTPDNVFKRSSINGNWNPEWKGLTPGMTYILEVTFTIPAGSEMVNYCMDYYGDVVPNCPIKNGNVTTCDCILTDTGGESGNYQNNQNFSYVICPDDNTKKTMLTFTSLTIKDAGDNLSVFDGNNNTFTKIFSPLSTTPVPASAIKSSISNSTGCLTVTFKSDASGTAAGWAAKISCFKPCTPPVANATTVEYTTTTNIKSCIGTTINFDGTSSVANATGGITTYKWDFGDGTPTVTGVKVSHTYNSPGIYSPTLVVTNADGCTSTNAIPHVVNIASVPNFKGTTTGSVCLNSQLCIDGKVNFIPINKKISISTPPIKDIPVSAGLTEVPITISGYNSGQKITSASDIQNILLNIEHSAISDLILTLVSPSGQKVILYKQTTSSSGGASVLGNPSMGGAALQGSCTWPPSSANGNERGQGLDYYFKSSATKTMAQLDEAQNWNQATLPCYQIPAGDYKPIDPLSNLIGSDINGTWIMQVQDNTNNDDGTVLNWKLNLDPSLLGNSAITPIVSVHKWTAVSGSDITSGAATSKLCVTPTSTSNTDYKYEITDDFGCKKDTTIKITINNAPTVTGPTTICEGSTVEWTSTSTLVSSDISLATIAANGTKFNVTALKPTSSPSNLKITATSSGCSTEKEITINPKAVTTIKCGNPTSNSVTVEWTSVTPATGYNIEVDKGSGYGSAIPVGISSLTYDVTGLSSTDVIKFKITPTGPTGPCYLISNEITCKPSNCPKPTLDNNFPVDATVCADLNATASFKVVATSTPEPTYKWQKIVGTNPAVDLQNDAVFDGVDKNILNIKNISGLDGVKFQCIATETSGTGCNITSFAKTLKINPLPTFTPTALDICEGEAPVITYPSLTGNPDKIIFDPGIPPIAPLNLTLSASPFKITGLPVPLPVNTYSGFKVKLENSTTGCKSTDITIPAFKVQATQKPSISSKSTSINSVTFQWSDLTGLNTQTGTTKDSYTIKEFVCSGCTTPGTYVNGTGTLSYNSTTSKWEYLKNGLTSGDKVFIEVTPVDVAPLAIPSCYTSSTFELVAITCISPVITKDIIDISLCEGTTALPVSTTLSLEYNSADATTPATWEILTPGGTWSTLNPTGIYTITGSTNIDSKLSISDIKGLDGTKYRVNLKTATASGSCNTISHEAILTVKQLPVMTSITDKLFCPGTIVNDPLKTTKDIEFKVSQYGTPTFTWVSDIQTTGVSTGSPNVNDFASFTTLSPSTDVVSKITVTPTLNQCVGQPFSFNITVKPTVKPIFSTSVTDFSSVKFVWKSSSIAPDFWEIDTAVTNVSVPQPPLNLYKAVTPIAGTINNYTVSGINSTKKAYINVKAKKSIASNDLFCPVADGYSGIPTPCVKPTKPLTPLANPVCEGSAISVTGVLPDALADFQWKISTDGGTIWNNVSTTDFGSTGTTNVLTTTTTKTYMNNAQVKLVLTDKLTGQCTEESDKVTLVINSLPTVKLIQPVKNSLCVDDNEVSATVQPLLGLSPMKVDYTMNGVTTTNKDIANLDIKFATSSETNHSLSIDKVTDANGCINLLTGLISSVSVYKNPTPAFTVSDTIGCLPLLVNFIDISGETYKDVTWDYGTGTNSSKDLGTSTFSYQKEGDYTVTYSVENMNGCKADIVIVDMIHVKKPPKAMISNDRNLINIYENVVRFDSKLSQNATFYRWDFGDNSSISNEAIVDHKYDPNSPGKFKVYLIVSNSPTNMTCSDTAITWIDFPEEVIYYIPNTFTPNGDEFNNTFQPIFSSGYDPQNYSFIIFDRWGQIVFESKNPMVGWDGTYGDKVLGNDTFVWKLGFKEKANDNEHYTSGHVNLVK